MRLSFVHAADLHLDSPFKGLGSSAQAASLGELFHRASGQAFERIVDLCVAERVDFLLLAGDLFDRRDRSVRARLQLERGLLRLFEAGVRAFVVHGNHDPLQGGGSERWPSTVKVFGRDWEECLVEREGTIIARVQGVSHGSERVTLDLSEAFRRVGPEFTVGLLHANLGGATGHEAYAPCTVAGLDEKGLDYWALGHVHTAARHPLPGGGVAVYPGNPQGRHINEAGPRGCVLVTVDGAERRIESVDLDWVRWHQVSLAVDEVEGLERLIERVIEKVHEACAGGEGRFSPEGHAVRVLLEGAGPLHAQLAAPAALEALEEQLRERLAGGRHAVLLESVRDLTRPAFRLEAVAALPEGLAAQLAQEALAADASLLRELFADARLRSLDGLLRQAGLPTNFDAGPELVRAAARRAVELLRAGEER